MIGCLRTLVRKQPIITLYCESENDQFHTTDVNGCSSSLDVQYEDKSKQTPISVLAL